MCSIQPRRPQLFALIVHGDERLDAQALLRSQPGQLPICERGALWLHFAQLVCVKHTGTQG